MRHTSYSERTNLSSQLVNINNHIPDHLPKVVSYLDSTKPLISRLPKQFRSEKTALLEAKTKQLQNTLADAQTHVDEIENTKNVLHDQQQTIESNQQDSTAQLKNIDENYNTLKQLIEQTIAKGNALENRLDEDKANAETISKLLEDAKAEQKLIENFAQKINQRETQLAQQQATTDKYEAKLTQFSNEHEEKLEETKKLIEDAKQALHYCTAQGLSAAFCTQYEQAKKDKGRLWLIGSGIFIVCAVGIGIWTLQENTNLNLALVIGRLALVPILLSGTWFCASQYMRKQNIKENYGYKSVLAKSMVGFSEQLSSQSNKGADYSHYIQGVLKEIHQHPLQKQNKAPTNTKALLEAINKISETIKSNPKQ